jgi:ACT domain-containing protein
MAVKSRFVDYYALQLADRPGTGAQALRALARAGVALDAVHAFPSGRGVQMDLVPARGAVLVRAARAAGLRLSRRKRALLIEGDDRTGALASVLERIAAARVNVTAVTGVRAGNGRFGAILWVKPRSLRQTAKALGVRA